ncbi:predicted protein [Phaeodactylum tricornutum CCAP 1055/1]|uniref:Uncharacterized protein n=1 Tax=Phaeodactylum tricornutum (strain CCAP 1055/1) TaxID=556484 RepID=B7G658_PHATC|nr:predicted protein [Phaeodactylum tricornutum CCAP 1055/1]EEC45954.1 predicted protein [Phaeodactylum tricornutum CCAP 1055/1]|eukprot:XP_002182667.1 predicted protein [Phaeodactylum tricornutum CCAP 1055/1]
MLGLVGALCSRIILSVQSGILRTGRFLLLLSLLLSLAYSFGWLHRLLWHLVESALSKALNGTPVTIGSLQFDLVRGRLSASNLILHSPRRDEWKWQSPVLARIGKLYVKTNVVYFLFSDWILGEEAPLEIYTLQLSDIQVFVERQQSFFNFYLLDPHNILPDPATLDLDGPGPTPRPGPYSDQSRTRRMLGIASPSPPAAGLDNDSRVDISSDPSDHHAQKVVSDMIKAVHDLGKAAQYGSLQGALDSHRQTITSQLRKLKASKKTDAMQEGVRIVQQVSKQVVEQTRGVKERGILPSRRTLPSNNRTLYARIGRVVLEDARVFTRDQFDEDKRSSASSWNKPIVLQSFIIKSAEFCPPLAAKDDEGYPLLYQPINALLDVVWKRILGEIAKSNTNILLQTAVGEVLDFWMEKEIATLPE